MHENVNNFLLLAIVVVVAVEIFVIFNKTSFPAMFLCIKMFPTQPTHRPPPEEGDAVSEEETKFMA